MITSIIDSVIFLPGSDLFKLKLFDDPIEYTIDHLGDGIYVYSDRVANFVERINLPDFILWVTTRSNPIEATINPIEDRTETVKLRERKF